MSIFLKTYPKGEDCIINCSEPGAIAELFGITNQWISPTEMPKNTNSNAEIWILSQENYQRNRIFNWNLENSPVEVHTKLRYFDTLVLYLEILYLHFVKKP